MPRKQLIKPMGSGQDRVRVYAEEGRVKVQWKKDGRTKKRTWEDSAANRRLAKSFAKGLLDARALDYVCLTLRELWDKYVEVEFPNLRESSQKNYSNRFYKWMVFAGYETPVDDTSITTIDEYRTQSTNAVNQVRGVITTVKIVYRWGALRGYLRPNIVTDYTFKMGKNEKMARPDEYTTEEFEAILSQLDPQDVRRWRASSVALFIGSQGTRQNATLNLRWADVDLDTRTVTWRADSDKMGREWTQPIRHGALSGLLTARFWADEQGVDSEWVWYSVKKAAGVTTGTEHWGAQAFWQALKNAEKRAGVESKPLRAAHGLRRMVAGDAHQVSDPLVAMRFIGDRDPRRAEEYIKERESLSHVADALDVPKRPIDAPNKTSRKTEGENV